MGILDDNTLRILRDGKVIGAMHKLADRQESQSGRGVKLDVTVQDKHGQQTVKRVIIRKVTR